MLQGALRPQTDYMVMKADQLDEVVHNFFWGEKSKNEIGQGVETLPNNPNVIHPCLHLPSAHCEELCFWDAT